MELIMYDENTVQSCWDEYKRVLQMNISMMQLSDHHLAFHAGALAMFNLSMELNNSDKTDQVVEEILLAIQEELHFFVESLDLENQLSDGNH